MRARQTAVHAVGVLGVRLSVLAGDARPPLQVPLAFLVDVGSCAGESKVWDKRTNICSFKPPT